MSGPNKNRTPDAELDELAASKCLKITSRELSLVLDEKDSLSYLRNQFVFPKLGTIPCETTGDPEEDCIYLLGNSLGLKPKVADKYMSEQMAAWGDKAIFMHTSGRVPAAYADQPPKQLIARIVGARIGSEVTVMNGLTVNLQLFMLAFYSPNNNKNKILIEDHAFPSDRYAVRSLLRVLGIPESRMLLIKPRAGEHSIRTADIVELIKAEADELALIMLPGVQYYTGQKLDMKTITRCANDLAIPIGWDLAHAAGNVELRLHEWGADFAVWCSYKYLNSGAGGISGAFLHEKHHANPPNHLQGWWSNKQETRFEMRDVVDPGTGAESFRLCNPPPWLTTLHLASLEIFDKVGMDNLLAKQFLLTGYLERLLRERLADKLDILTPSDPSQRGCQLSLVFSTEAGTVHKQLETKGVICDVRGRVMRVAPVPLYNSFNEVWRFVDILHQTLTN